MALDLGSAVGRIILNTSGFSSGVNTAIIDLERLQNKSKGIASKIGGVGKSLQGVGKSLTKNVTTPITALATASVVVSSNFEKNMSKVSAISGATGSNLEALKKKAMEMGAKTKFSASESAQAFQYMAMAGWKTEDMLKGIDGIMNLSAADGLDLATTSDIVTDALTAFGLQAKDSSHFADVLAKVSSSANTNVSMLGESFKYCAPVAGAMGYSVEDVSVALGTMANSGIKASSAGNALKNIITNLAKPTASMAAAMERYGISLTDANGDMLPLQQVLENMRDRFSTLSEAQKANLAATLAGKTGMSGLLAIMNASEKDWDSLTNSINKADGTAKKMSDTMIDNLSGSITLLKSALEGLGIQFGEILTPIIRNVVDHITRLTEKLSSMSMEEKEQVVKIAAIVASVGPLVTVMGNVISTSGKVVNAFSLFTGAGSKVIKGFTNMREAMVLSNAGLTAFSAEAKASAMAASPLGAVIGGITAPVLAVVAAIAALTAAFVYLWKTNEDFRNNVTGLWSELVGKFSEFFQGITERLNQLGFNFKDISEVIMAVWDALCNLLAPAMEGALKSVVNTVSTCLDIIMSVVDIFVGLFTGNWKQCLNGFKSLFTTTWKYTVNNLKNTLNTMKGVLDVALSWFGTSWNKCWNGIVNFFKGIPGKVSNILSNMVSSAKSLLNKMVSDAKTSGQNFVNGLINFIKNLPYNVGYLLGQVIDNVANFAMKMESKAKETGKNFVNGVINFIKNLPSNAVNIFNTVVSNTASFATSFVGKAKSAGKQFLTSVVNGIKKLPNNVKSTVNNVIKNVTSFVKTMGKKGKSAASDFKNSIVTGMKEIPGKAKEIGANIVTGLWNGIAGMKDTIMNNIKEFGNGLIDGLKGALDIHSPSKRAKKEVGEMFAQGVIEGVKAKKGAAKKSSEELSNEIVKAAKKKMDRLKAYNKVTLQDEVKYWAKVEKACKNGSKAETEAHKKWLKAKKEVNKKAKEENAKVLSDAEKYWDKQTTYHTKSAKEEAEYWKGVLKKLKKGSDEYLEAYKKYVSAKNNIESEKVSEAEKNYDRMTIVNDMSAQDEADYWYNVLKTLKKGSDEYYDVYKKYINAKNNVDSERLAGEEKYLEDTKQYYTVSLKAEMDYWDKLRRTYKEGSEERKEADKKYLDAKEAYTSKLKEIEEDYASEVKRINEELNTTVENLYKEYDDKLKSRVDSIMGTFKLFEGYTFEEASGNAQDLIGNLQSQVDAIETYGDELNKIAARGIVPDDMFEELKGLGVGATENLKVINSMTDEELVKYVGLWQQKTKEATSIAEEELKPMKEATEKAVKEATEAAGRELTQLKKTYDMKLREINATSSQLSQKVGKDISSCMAYGIKEASVNVTNTLSKLVSYVTSKLDTVKSALNEMKRAAEEATNISGKSSSMVMIAKKINGSHKNGLSRVPYDGYIAELHEGERVLTKEEAEKDRQGGDTFIFNSPKAIDEKEAARQMKRAKRELALQY